MAKCLKCELRSITEALKKDFDNRLKVWNLKCLEEKLTKEKKNSDAFIVRQVLDLISPNWRSTIDYLDIEVK